MTIEEKREVVRDYCGSTSCGNCLLATGDWIHNIGNIGSQCLSILDADEDELDRALELIKGTTTEVIGCDNCKYTECNDNVEPCASCKHNKVPYSEEYNNAPENYKPLYTPTTVTAPADNFRTFSTGAKRDVGGKGRMDLLPWAAIMEVSKHCENGALKYGEHNVDKGIPTSSLCDSAARHLAKHIDGWTDEPHLLAAAWNLLWAIQMEIKHPELVDVPWRVKPDVEVNSARELEQIREE